MCSSGSRCSMYANAMLQLNYAKPAPSQRPSHRGLQASEFTLKISKGMIMEIVLHETD